MYKANSSFGKSREKVDIIKIIKNDDILNEEAIFSCHVDGITEFHLKEGVFLYVFYFVSKDDFINKMSVDWIINLRFIEFFWFTKSIAEQEVESVIFNRNELLNIKESIKNN